MDLTPAQISKNKMFNIGDPLFKSNYRRRFNINEVSQNGPTRAIGGTLRDQRDVSLTELDFLQLVLKDKIDNFGKKIDKLSYN